MSKKSIKPTLKFSSPPMSNKCPGSSSKRKKAGTSNIIDPTNLPEIDIDPSPLESNNCPESLSTPEKAGTSNNIDQTNLIEKDFHQKAANSKKRPAFLSTPEKTDTSKNLHPTNLYAASPPKKAYNNPVVGSPTSPCSGQITEYTGFISAIFKAKSRNGNDYMDVKLKESVDDYRTIRFMKNQNPNISEEFLKSFQIGYLPIKLTNVYITNSGTGFFNTFRGSRIEEGVSVSFKYDDQASLSIKEVLLKSSGTFTVEGCFKWFKETKTVETKTASKKLREGILYDGVTHVILTLWEDLVDFNFNELTQWYEFTHVNVRHYFGPRLSTTTLSTVNKLSTNDLKVNWDQVDENYYQMQEENANKTMHPKQHSEDLLNACINIYPACSNSNCAQKVIIIPGEKLVHCNHCNRRMKPTKCITSFGAILEFGGITLTLPLSVLETFLEVNVMETYSHDTDSLIEKLLYLENVDFEYNSKKLVTKMDNRYY